MSAYEYGNNNDVLDYEYDDDDTVRYNRNSREFQHSINLDGKMKLKPKHTFFTIYGFKNVLKAFVIKNYFKLKRIKNKKTRVTCKCAIISCK